MIQEYKYSSVTITVTDDPYIWASDVPVEDVTLINRIAEINHVNYKEDF